LFVINLVDLPCCDQISAAVPSTQSIILNDIPAPPPLAENSDAVTEIEGLVAKCWLNINNNYKIAT
jgi:hypothetical protein